MATALFLCNSYRYDRSVRVKYRSHHLRVRVWFGKLESNIQKPLLELFGKPGACGKAADKERELLMDK
jgi:hypothetical protein